MAINLKIGGRWHKRLQGLPESGMGYQIVDITLNDGRVLKRIIISNAENVYLPDGYDESDIAEIQMSNQQR